jgi:hypothetical protein
MFPSPRDYHPPANTSASPRVATRLTACGPLEGSPSPPDSGTARFPLTALGSVGATHAGRHAEVRGSTSAPASHD